MERQSCLTGIIITKDVLEEKLAQVLAELAELRIELRATVNLAELSQMYTGVCLHEPWQNL